MPLPNTIQTYAEFSHYLWKLCIRDNISKYNVSSFYLVIDKSNFLPPPRQLVHASRSQNATLECIPPVAADTNILHSSDYSSALCVPEYKSNLINILLQQFIFFALSATTNSDITIMIDSPSFNFPVHIAHKKTTSLPQNQHGEADYAVWYHAINSQSLNILLISGDTDSWVYGMGIFEAGWLRDKFAVVQRGISGEFVNINLGVCSTKDYPSLRHLQHPVAALVGLYVLSGCDYTSSFFQLPKERFLQCFLENAQYVCSTLDDFLEFELDSNGHALFKDINISAWLKLVCSVYLIRHK